MKKTATDKTNFMEWKSCWLVFAQDRPSRFFVIIETLYDDIIHSLNWHSKII